MKKIIFLLAVLLLPLAASAQFKFGYLSYDEAIKSMPEHAVAQKNIASLKEQYDNEIKRAENEFNEKYKLFLEEQSTMAPAILRKRQSDLQDLLDKNVAFRKESDRLLRQAEDDIYSPLRARLKEILGKTAQERGYAFILNTDNNALPFVNPACGEDINAVVKEALEK